MNRHKEEHKRSYQLRKDLESWEAMALLIVIFLALVFISDPDFLRWFKSYWSK